MKFKIATLGCRNNQYESAEVRACFEKEGFQPVPFNSRADICVINTCSVTEKSNYRCRQIIRKTVDSNPDSFVVVVGCYPQLDTNAVKSLHGVDLILGNDEKLDIIEHLRDLNVNEQGKSSDEKTTDQKLMENLPSDPFLQQAQDRHLRRRGSMGGRKLIDTLQIQKKKPEPKVIVGNSSNDTTFRSEEVNHFAGKTKAFLKIQTGCNYKCAFCVITLARGQSRSADTATVVRQFNRLLENNFREITLSGIHLGSFGKDLSSQTSLYELLRELIKIEGNFRIRLSSLGPKDISDELIDLIASSPKICNHLHISLQSGSDRILRLMKRNYRMENVYELMDKLSGRIPDIGIGADLIAGFPGETDQEFQETLGVVKELPFSYLHVFNFSRRKNAAAYDLPDQVPNRVRKQRVFVLKELARQKSKKFKERFLGKDLYVLIEQNRDPETGSLKGYTGNYMSVHIDGSDDLINQIIPVRLSRIENETLFGVYSGNA